ncbi:MAG: phosphoserine transaminase [Rhodospirillaceae bacterium]|nr:phosphoserine transaminase [Rhodospirillaceae bacterium]
MKPSVRPDNPLFSSGPCPKRPGWSVDVLSGALLGRSHRAREPLARIQELLERSRALLGLPDGWRIGIVPGSDTGAIEMAMWSLLGPRGVDFLRWDNFGALWAFDGERELRPLDARVLDAPFGRLPDLAQVDPNRDTVFVWNGTTSGVRVPDAEWIAADRAGLTFCDATSAVLAYPMDWTRLDATTYSWQKVLGGEAGFGMLILGPRAVERLESAPPPWPVPRVFRLTTGDGRLNEGIFRGETINTVSMMAIEDTLDALRWIESIGGQRGMIARARANFGVIEAWVAEREWVDFLAEAPETRSHTSVCLSIADPWFNGLGTDEQWDAIKLMCALLEAENAAYDIKTHRAAPPGLRIWCGGTVQRGDLEALTPWLDWAWDEMRRERAG